LRSKRIKGNQKRKTNNSNNNNCNGSIFFCSAFFEFTGYTVLFSMSVLDKQNIDKQTLKLKWMVLRQY